ncbi:quinolinate synthase NadA [bacterium]|nr:quinolinate synthase NadA [bacterium]
MLTTTAPIDPTLDLFDAIDALKRERNAIILAHYYQEADIQDVADFLGDSLALAQAAEKTDADVIVFAGVHFMAETAKILNPTKKVLLPDLAAGCSLADSCPAEGLAALKARHPDHVVVSYINCTAEVKALSDYIVTSSNAVKIINSIPKDQGIIFAPDRNLGRYLVKETGRDMVLWQGSCMVHETFSARKIHALKMEHPGSLIIAHPECEDPVLAISDVVGSTSALLKYVTDHPEGTYIVATEPGIIHQMQKASPKATLVPAPPEDDTCACNDCPHMKLNTLEKLYLCLRDLRPEITMDEDLRVAALKPIKRMLELS